MKHFTKIYQGLKSLMPKSLVPKSLMTRYTLALIAIAGLVALEQYILQAALDSHVEDQRIARLVDVQQFETSRLVKSAMALQLASRDTEIREHARTLKEVVEDFRARQTRIDKLAGSTKGLTSAYNRLGLQKFSYEEKGWLSRQDRFELRKSAMTIDKYNAAYRAQLRGFLIDLDQRSQDRIEDTTRLEFALFLLVLVVLVLEGLFIFRPSIRGLEEALRTRSEFMSRMSHEIRNPMNAIIGMTDVLFETPLNGLQQRYLRVLSRSSQTLLDLLNSLLDFSSLESGKTQIEKIPFDLHNVLEKVVDLSAVRAHEKNIDLSLDIDLGTQLSVIGDPVRLHQVLSNLLSNAIKFTPSGEVRLSVSPAKTQDNQPCLQFSVADTGIGIKAEALKKIFDSFVQADTSTRRQYGGSGLGLTISRELVTMMGGELSVRSEVGAGSVFEFCLPLGVSERASDTLGSRVEKYSLNGRTAFLLGPMTPSIEQATHLIKACGGKIETKLSAVDLKNENTFVIISPLADDSLIQFLPEQVAPATRIICLIQTILPAGRMKTYMNFGVSEFIISPIKPLEFLESIVRGDESDIAESAVANSSQTNVSGEMKILVVDDSNENRDLIKLYLAKEELQIVMAADGAQAVQKFQTDRFDLVLTDIQMPIMDGIEELSHIREWEEAKKLAPTPVVAITADSRSEARINLTRCGFQEILVKPLRKTDLLDLINRHRPKAGFGDVAQLDTRTGFNPDVPESDPEI